MGDAKQIRLAPIQARDAARLVRALHYSGRPVQNSQLHLGAFLGDRCGGVLSFGPSMDKRRLMTLVKGTGLRDFLELNRMAFADWMPRNGESRSIAMACRWIRKRHERIRWIISYADGTQCGDGTIYRAAGFLLTGIRRNKTLWRLPDGEIVPDITLNLRKDSQGRSGLVAAREAGAKPLPGFQLRYVKFLDPAWRSRLTCDVLPYAAIAEAGASMYKGQRGARADGGNGNTSGIQPEKGGSIPTSALQSPEAD